MVSIRKKQTFRHLLCVLIIISTFAHFSTNVFGRGNITYINYICWFLFIACLSVLFKKIYIARNEFVLLLLLTVNIILSLIGQSLVFGFAVADFHQSLFYFILYLFVVCIKSNIDLNYSDIKQICKVVICLGLFSLLYSYANDTSAILSILSGTGKASDSWSICSFFHQRGTYASFCCWCAICSIYLWGDTKKNIYPLFATLFLIQIYFTDSRTGLLTFLVFIVLCFFLSVKEKSVLILGGIIAFFAALFVVEDVIFWVYENFQHNTILGIDSATIRLIQWSQGIVFLWENHAFFTGLGQSSGELFLKQFYSYASFHNAYIDILFASGLLGLFLYVYPIFRSIKRLLRCQNTLFKNVWISGICSLCVNCLTTSGSMVLGWTYFSVLTTILFIIIPNYVKEDNKEATLLYNEENI